MNKLYNILFYLGILLFLIGALWSVIITIQLWNIPLTQMERWYLSWKPIIVIWIGAGAFLIGINKKKLI